MVIIGISVICYNKEKFIIKALDSIYNQEIFGIYINCVIVNDSSTDNSKTVINEYIQTHNDKDDIHFELVNSSENLGAGKSKLNAVKVLRYKYNPDYYMFLDGDDYYIHNDFINKAYNYAIGDDVDMVEFGFRYNTKNEVIKKVPIINDDYIIVDGGEHTLAKTLQGNYISFMMWSKIISKELMNKVELSDKIIYEDIVNVSNWIYNANKIIIVSSEEINYRYNKNSLTQKNILNSKYETLKTLYEIFKKYGTNEEIVRALYNRSYIDFSNILLNFTSNDINNYDEIYFMYDKIFKKLQELYLY